jgi:hypothetical protein
MLWRAKRPPALHGPCADSTKSRAAVRSFSTTSSRPVGGPCGDPSPPVRRQPGRGVVPTISVYMPYPSAHLTRPASPRNHQTARLTPEARISLAVPGRLMRSLVAEGPGTPYGVHDRTGPRTSPLITRDPDAAGRATYRDL